MPATRVISADLLWYARRHRPDVFAVMQKAISQGLMVVAQGAGGRGAMLKAGTGAERPGHKYIRRVPTGNPKDPWHYVYPDDEPRRQLSLFDVPAKPADVHLTLVQTPKPAAQTPAIARPIDLFAPKFGDAEREEVRAARLRRKALRETQTQADPRTDEIASANADVYRLETQYQITPTTVRGVEERLVARGLLPDGWAVVEPRIIRSGDQQIRFAFKDDGKITGTYDYYHYSAMGNGWVTPNAKWARQESLEKLIAHVKAVDAKQAARAEGGVPPVRSLTPHELDHDAEMRERVDAGFLVKTTYHKREIPKGLGGWWHEPTKSWAMPSAEAVEKTKAALGDAEAEEMRRPEVTPPPPPRRVARWGASEGMTPDERRTANAQALHVLDLADKRPLTDDERATVALYSGEGGAGVGASLNQYYTRPDVAEAVWTVLRRNGLLPKEARVLEPAAGSGVFLETAPPDVRMTAVEIDSPSARICAALHPTAEVIHAPFEDIGVTDPGGYDAVISNAPFLLRQDGTRRLHKRKLSSADQYFLDTSLDKVRDGGIVAMIVHHGVADNTNMRAFRERLMHRAELVAAHRLPTGAFEHSHTTVTSDLLVFRKRPEAVGQALILGGRKLAMAAGTWNDDFVKGSWFDSRPANVHGTPTNDGNFGSLQVVGSAEGVAAKIAGALPLPAGPALTTTDLLVHAGDDGALADAVRRGATIDPNDGLVTRGATKVEDGVTYILWGDPPRWHRLEDVGEDVRAVIARTKPPIIAEALTLATEVDTLALLTAHNRSYDARRLRRELAPKVQAWVDANGLPSEHADLVAEAKGNPKVHSFIAAVRDDKTLSDLLQRDMVARLDDAELDTADVVAVAERLGRQNDGRFELSDVTAAWTGGSGEEALALLLASDHFAVEGIEPVRFRQIEDYLTGNLYRARDRLRADIAVQVGRDATSALAAKLRWQDEQLTAALERMARSLDDAEISMRSGWIPPDVLQAFLDEWWRRKRNAYRPVTVEYTGATYQIDWGRGVGRGDEWDPDAKKDRLPVVERFLNRLSLSKRQREEVEEVEVQFAEWIRASKYRDTLEDSYNRAYFANVRKEFSPAPLDVPGLNPDVTLHPFQNQTVRWCADQGRGIIALDVGLGKTPVAIMLARLLRQRGRSRKITVIAPLSVATNWQEEVQFFTPGATVLVVGEHKQEIRQGPRAKAYREKQLAEGKSLEWIKEHPLIVTESDKDEHRIRKLHDMRQNDYDLVIITKPAYQMIPVSPERAKRYSEDDFWNQKALEEGKDETAKTKKAKARSAESEAKRIAKQKAAHDSKIAGKEYESHDEAGIYWEDLGVDTLIVDEAHAYKNLYGAKQRYGESPKFLGGSGESIQAQDMLYKSRVVREKNNGKGVFFLTATPVKNSPLEVYNMTQHIAPEEWNDRRGIRNSEEFIDRYCVIEPTPVLTPALVLKDLPAVVGFKNMKEVQGVMDSLVYTRTAADVGLKIPAPDPHSRLLTMTDIQRAVYDELRQNALDMAEETSQEPGAMFRNMEAMRKAATDLTLYRDAERARAEKFGIQYTPADVRAGAAQARAEGFVGDVDGPFLGDVESIPDDEWKRSPKYLDAVANIMERSKVGGQVVFIDYVASHERLKTLLVEAGMPADKIGIINAQVAKDSGTRQAIGRAFNAGDLKVVIGNTACMGEGVNLQKKTSDIHHLDQPWDPGSMQQRNGRAVRQGNKAETVQIHTYLTKGSFDGLRHSTLTGKKAWLDKLRAGVDTIQNDAFGTDEDGSMAANLDRATMLAMLSADPDAALEKIQGENAERKAVYVEKKRADAVKEFEQLQKYRGAYERQLKTLKDLGVSTNTDSANRMRARIELLRKSVDRNPFLDDKLRTYLHLDTPVIVDPNTGLAVHRGAVITVGPYAAPGLNMSSQPRDYMVTGVDLTARQFKLRPFGASQKNRKPDLVTMEDIAKKPGAFTATTHTAMDEIEHTLARADKSSASSHLFAHLPPESLAAHEPRVRTLLRDALKDYDGNGDMLAVGTDRRVIYNPNASHYYRKDYEPLIPTNADDWRKMVAAADDEEAGYASRVDAENAARRIDADTGRDRYARPPAGPGIYEAVKDTWGKAWASKLEVEVAAKRGPRPALIPAPVRKEAA